jgi:hypothetical protein
MTKERFLKLLKTPQNSEEDCFPEANKEREEEEEMQHHLYILDPCILYDHTAKTRTTPCQQGTTKRKKKRREEEDGEMDLLHCIVAVVKEAPNGEVVPQLHQQL